MPRTTSVLSGLMVDNRITQFGSRPLDPRLNPDPVTGAPENPVWTQFGPSLIHFLHKLGLGVHKPAKPAELHTLLACLYSL